MSSVEFQTLALVLLVVAATTVAWILYLDRDERQEVARNALEGVGHELRLTIQRFMSEIGPVARGEQSNAGDFMPVQHPQMDAIFAHAINANRNALSVFGATYQTLQARKIDVRAALDKGTGAKREIDEAIDTIIDAIVTLYLWEEHGGARPVEAASTRSWHVRDWMKAHNFRTDAFPGLHLRDEVVERLRQYGMTLTPAPLSMTAHEYWSMQYDRKADERAPFGRRLNLVKPKPVTALHPDGDAPDTTTPADRSPGETSTG